MDISMKTEENLSTPQIQKIFKQSWILILILYIFLALIRGLGAFGHENIRMLIMVGFILMWFLPFLFFSKHGRRSIGIKKVENPLWLLWGVLIGSFAAFAILGIGALFTMNNIEHWYISIVNQVISPEMRELLPFVSIFFMTTIPSMIFSPIGEELFFRGMIHETIREKTGEKIATLVNSFAFALVHIFHYGFVLDGTKLQYLVGPGIVWFLLMFTLSVLFTVCRKKSGSIFPAILAHSSFNLVMCITTFCILL
jgi:membrane protease YdiL (CAAX protease family)